MDNSLRKRQEKANRIKYIKIWRKAQSILTKPFGYSISIPSTIQIEPTMRCNLSCDMCPRNSLGFSKRNIPDMSLEKFEAMIDKLPNGIGIINIWGLGEPLLNKDIVKFVSVAKRKTAVHLLTNGILLDSQLIYDLFEAGLSGLSVSMDSPYKQACEEIRRGVNYGVLVRNISTAAEIRRKEFPQVRLSIWMTVSEQNFDSIKDMIELCHVWGIEALSLRGLHTNKLIKRVAYIPEYKKRIKDIEDYAKTKGIFLECRYIDYEDASHPRLCDVPWHMIYIDCNGTVNPCSMHESREMEEIGNIFTETFGMVWNGPKMRAFRRAMMSKNKPSQCRTCDQFYG